MFNKYMHLERFSTEEVVDINLGTCHVFPKLDGTNGSVWKDAEGLQAGSRNRQLSLDKDNAGFFGWVLDNPKLASYMGSNSHHTLYGEWLVPHSLKTYEDSAWKRFYVFDVLDTTTGQLLHYDDYHEQLELHGVDYLPPLAIIKNGTAEHFHKCLDKNVFLIRDGEGIGEGVVIKNYNFVNKYGRVVWAKIITNAFKLEHHKVMGAPLVGSTIIEEKIVDEYVTKHFVDKVYDKIVNEEGGWSSKFIPRLLQTVYYDLIREELWDIVKSNKNPTINFSFLNKMTLQKIKEIRSDVF